MSRPHPAAVVILAAGQGTRMKSEIPRVLHPTCDCTFLDHAIFAAWGLVPDHIAAVVRHERDYVAARAVECDPGIMIADQGEIEGTGRALWCGLRALSTDLSGPAVVTAGDTPLLSIGVLLHLLGQHEGNVVTVLTAVVPDSTGYDRIVRDAEGTTVGIVKHKDATQEQREIAEINAPTYVLDADFLRGVIGGLDTENAQGEMYLADVVAKAYESGAGVGLYVVKDSWLVEGCNDPIQLAGLQEQVNWRTLEAWMRSGATIVDPVTTSIGVTAALAPDRRILPGMGPYGTVSIMRGALVGPGEFTSTLVGEGADAHRVVVRDAAAEAETAPSLYIMLTGGARAAGVSEQRGKL